MSRLIQLTALIFFIYAAYRLFRYFTNWLPYPEFMIYAIFTAIVIGTGTLIFDDVFKPGNDYVGWAFLFGVGFLSIIFGAVFLIIPPFTGNPGGIIGAIIGPFWSRAIFFIAMGIIIIIESLLVRREVFAGDHGLNSDTIGPVILKFTAVFGLAFGGYQMSWVLVSFIRNIDIFVLMPLLLSALGLVLVCGILLIYAETQKRRPHFRMRRLPLLLSFLLLLLSLPNTAIYLQIFLGTVPITPDEATIFLNLLFNALTALGVGITLLLTSFYVVYHPTKAR